MTKQEFLSLEPQEQETFINEGGTISSTEVISFSSTDEQKQSGSSEGVCSTSSRDASKSSANTTAEAQTAPSFPDSYGFDIKDPVELLYLLDDEVASGKVKLHPWQIQFMLDFAEERTQAFPFQGIVKACNGSGKDKVVVASCSVWLCMRYNRARCVITSSSGQQLDNQTEVYIKMLCQAANTKFGGEVWKTNARYYECLATQSPMKLFATDEPGKAEGYHPLTSDGKMAIFTSEGKTISDEIFTALERCTGYTHRVDVSTPGLPLGYFYNTSMTAIPRFAIKSVFEIKPEQFILYHIQAKDCPHITPNVLEKLKATLPGGENGAAYKSAVYAEFGTTDEMVVIPSHYVWKAASNTTKWLQEPFNKAGLDLSDGGDETALTVRNGNKHLKTLAFRFDNAEDTVAYLIEQFNEWNLNSPEAFIYGDAGGLGKPILDRLWGIGYKNVRYILNQSKAYNPTVYLNRGTELWFHLRTLLERGELILQGEPKLNAQLSSRYYKITGRNVHQLLSKRESRSRGYPSPDRADSLTLAFWDYKSTRPYTLVGLQDAETVEAPFSVPPSEKQVPAFSLKEWASDSKTKWKTDDSKQDFSYLQEEVARYNHQLKQNNRN